MRWLKIILAAVQVLALAAGPAAGPSAVIGTIASKAPITIDGAEMSPAAAPAWPLAAENEISNSAPAMLKTATRDVFTFDSSSRARIGTVESGRPYVFLRQGGVHFSARAGLVYICMAGRLFVPEKAAEGSLKLDVSGLVTLRIEHGLFAEQGTLPCAPTAPPNFLSGLPAAAGGTLAGVAGAGAGAAAGAVAGASAGAAAAGGIGAATVATVVGTGVAAAAGASSAASATATCSSQAGCNFNPGSISPSQP